MKNKDTPEIFSAYPDVLTVEDLSMMLGISTKTAYKLLKEKKIKSVTIGRTYKIPKFMYCSICRSWNNPNTEIAVRAIMFSSWQMRTDYQGGHIYGSRTSANTKRYLSNHTQL